MNRTFTANGAMARIILLPIGAASRESSQAFEMSRWSQGDLMTARLASIDSEAVLNGLLLLRAVDGTVRQESPVGEWSPIDLGSETLFWSCPIADLQMELETKTAAIESPVIQITLTRRNHEGPDAVLTIRPI